MTLEYEYLVGFRGNFTTPLTGMNRLLSVDKTHLYTRIINSYLNEPNEPSGHKIPRGNLCSIEVQGKDLVIVFLYEGIEHSLFIRGGGLIKKINEYYIYNKRKSIIKNL